MRVALALTIVAVLLAVVTGMFVFYSSKLGCCEDRLAPLEHITSCTQCTAAMHHLSRCAGLKPCNIGCVQSSVHTASLPP